MSEPDFIRKGPGGLLFAALFLAFSLFLLSQLGAETKFSAKGKLFAQPAFWPAVGVFGMVFFGALHVITRRRADIAAELAEGAVWLRPFEYLVWFMAYVTAAPQIGYLAATVIFMVLMALRAGYRSARMLIAAALTGLAIVLIFKTFLQVKIPGGAIYEALPDAIRNFMIVNF